MSKCFDGITKSLITNINEKALELKQISSSLEKMGVFTNCPQTQRKQFNDLLKEISISGLILEQSVIISQVI
jgi:hypothetical protein